MRAVFAFDSTLWDALVHPLSYDVETAAVIIARTATTVETLTFLARRVMWVPDDSYAKREAYRLEIRSTGFVPALGAAERDGGVAVFVHTHPGGDPSPSDLDEEVDRALQEVFRRRTRQDYYVSLILGGSAEDPRFSGRVLTGGRAEPILIDRIRVCGKRVSLLAVSGTDASPSAQFDRQILAFGKEGQAVLTGMRVGVVGAGGTGSAGCEQLVRLGVGSLTVVDDDVVDVSNLSRLHEATGQDVGTAKVEIIQRRAQQIRDGVEVRPVNARLRSEEICRQLLDCDVIFGCTDDAFGR